MTQTTQPTRSTGWRPGALGWLAVGLVVLVLAQRWIQGLFQTPAWQTGATVFISIVVQALPFLALGVADRCARLIGDADDLLADIADVRLRLLTAAPEEVPEARAASGLLAARAAARLVVHTGSRSVLADEHAGRLYRESGFLLVFGQRPAIRQALLLTDPFAKVRATRALVRGWRRGDLAFAFDAEMPDRPGRPDRPELLAVRVGDDGAVHALYRKTEFPCDPCDMALYYGRRDPGGARVEGVICP